MRNVRECVGVLITLVLVAPLTGAAAAPTPRATPAGAAVKKPSRADLPRCDELRLTAHEMSAAFQKHAVDTGDAPQGQGAFDAIGDELGCRWPWSAADSRRGMMQLLEKAGGRTGSTK